MAWRRRWSYSGSAKRPQPQVPIQTLWRIAVRNRVRVDRIGVMPTGHLADLADDDRIARLHHGLVVAAARTFAEWDAHPHAGHIRNLPPITWTRMGDAPPLALPAIGVSRSGVSGKSTTMVVPRPGKERQ